MENTAVRGRYTASKMRATMRDATEVDEAAPAPRLPRGRHGLTREQVRHAQRGRLLRAMAEAMAEQGYVQTSVADVLKRAGVSRETFYELFSSKQDCFIAAYEYAADVMLADLEHEAGSGGDALERFDRSLGAYLEALAEEPAFARLFMVEVYSGGDEVLSSRAEIQRRFAQAVAEAFDARTPGDRFACEALVAAVITMVTARLAARDIEGLRALHEPLIQLVRRAFDR
jgi:AcrR family transcriptional regulator